MFNEARNNATEILRHANKDPFLAQLVQGQKLAAQINRCRKYDSYITVQEGLLFLGFSTKRLNVDDKMKVEQNTQGLDLAAHKRNTLRSRQHSVCDNCAAIPFHKLPFEEDPGYPHQQSIPDLIDSSETRGLCNLILMAVEDAQKDFDQETFETPNIINCGLDDSTAYVVSHRNTHKKFVLHHTDSPGLLKKMESSKYTCPGSTSIDTAKRVLGCDFGGTEIGGYWQGEFCFLTTFTLYTVGPLWDKIPGRRVALDSQEDSLFAKLKAWILGGDITHKCAPEQSELPTRVFDLKDAQKNEEIWLLETHGMRGKYIALSHCWGRTYPLRTTTATLQSHKKAYYSQNYQRPFRMQSQSRDSSISSTFG
ncbi:hypothetical protein K469DRAFT_694572 [Zopfia rhizophila CBS 207.26]|uniref:Heterokaryon incompatibility domain-containing protein n=1 Tax=Zopfia rhizophila CBS 207.26 TaxID=1314779 RepID=A0A6A6EQW4_9PEZI|nr:hypothetical protein K469DRAFT_694572 [Zopfia rhizophila CBS 207.26]